MSTFMSGLRGKLLGFGGGLLLLMAAGVSQANSVTYVYTDPQGTPLAEADVNGNITATFDYAPYGSIALGTAPNGPGYTGHVNDPDTQLVYMQARYYDPAVGRFLSVDPVGPAAGNAFKFNRFAYANNNPIVNMDPDGRDSDDDPGIAGPGYRTYVNPGPSEGGSGKSASGAGNPSSGNDQSGAVSVPSNITPSGNTYSSNGDAAKAFGDRYYAAGVAEHSEYQTGIISKTGGFDYILPGAGPPGANIVDPKPLFNAIKGAGFQINLWAHTHWDGNLKFSGSDMIFFYKTHGTLFLTNKNDQTYMLNGRLLNNAASGYKGAEGILQYIDSARTIQGQPVQ